MTDVDVIVLDLDGGALLDTCLASLRAQTLPPKRVIVFDNGSRTPVPARPGVELLRSETNLGFTGGVNAAFRHVTAPFVALINNDVVLEPDWLETVVEAMDDGKVAAVQTVIRRDAATIDGAGIDVRDGTIRQIGSGLPLHAVPGEAWGVSATAALYRVVALGERVFDPRFFAYYEDVELSARLHGAGWRTVVLPTAKATHRGSQSASRLGARATFLRTRNRYFVARLHRGVGRVGALLREDVKLLLQGRASLRGMIAGLFGRMKDEG
ncbi:MAG: glycosyl transferase family 2 [Acidobacteria bacterium]|nr:glycosyl transferase family 2 [Acidobacteriota bacterium]